MNYNVQALRALAAYGVVGHHILDGLHNYIAVGRTIPNPAVGATGVNIFFVISGFIMVLTTSERATTPRSFIAHRIVRVVPIYWLLTLLAAAIMLCGFRLFARDGLDPGSIATSFLFLPDIGADGRVAAPILFVGWTLNYEMMFYAIFALGLFLPAPLRRWAICAAIGLLWLAQFVGSDPYLDYWGNDIILAFALGILLWRPSSTLPLPPTAALLVIPLSLVGLALPDLFGGLAATPHHGILVTAAAGALVFAAASLERRGRSVGEGWIVRQGDASYSLYLLHPFVLQLIGKASILSGLNRTIPGLCLIVVAMVVACGAAATIFHRRIERPLTRQLRRTLRAFSGRAAAPGRRLSLAARPPSYPES